MEKSWFRRFGWFYLPTSVPGAMVFLRCGGFLY